MSLKKNLNRKKSPWEVRWIEDGKHYSRSFATKQQAQDFDALRRAGSNDGSRGRTSDEKLTVDHYAEMYLQRKKKDSTTLRNQGIYVKHIQPFIGSQLIQSIRYTDLQRLVDNWVDIGLKPRTVIRQIAVLSRIFELATRDRVILSNPAKGLEKPEPAAPHRYAMNIDEIARLLEVIHPNYRAFVLVLIDTGMRVGEATALNIGDYDWVTGTLNIGESKTAAGIRKIRLTQISQKLISEHIKSTGRSMAHSTEPLFVSHKTDSGGIVVGTRINYSNFHKRIFKPAAASIGLPELQIHDCRRTISTHMIDRQASMMAAAERLGHGDIRTTMNLYAQATPEAHEAVVGMLEELLGDAISPRINVAEQA